jgi:hypothetical protein
LVNGEPNEKRFLYIPVGTEETKKTSHATVILMATFSSFISGGGNDCLSSNLRSYLSRI